MPCFCGGCWRDGPDRGEGWQRLQALGAPGRAGDHLGWRRPPIPGVAPTESRPGPGCAVIQTVRIGRRPWARPAGCRGLGPGRWRRPGSHCPRAMNETHQIRGVEAPCSLFAGRICGLQQLPRRPCLLLAALRAAESRGAARIGSSVTWKANARRIHSLPMSAQGSALHMNNDHASGALLRPHYAALKPPVGPDAAGMLPRPWNWRWTGQHPCAVPFDQHLTTARNAHRTTWWPCCVSMPKG